MSWAYWAPKSTTRTGRVGIDAPRRLTHRSMLLPDPRAFTGAQNERVTDVPWVDPTRGRTGEDTMANPALSEKRFENDREGRRGRLGRARRAGARRGHRRTPPPTTRVVAHDRERRVRQDLRPLPHRARRRSLGWSQTDVATTTAATSAPRTSTSRAGRGSRSSSGSVLAMVCIFKPKASPFLAPLYARRRGHLPRRDLEGVRVRGTASSSRRSSPPSPCSSPPSRSTCSASSRSRASSR